MDARASRRDTAPGSGMPPGSWRTGAGGHLAGPGQGLGCPRTRGRHRAGWSGQPHAHRGAAATRARADVDAATAPRDRAPDHGEPEPHPRRGARREERIEHSPPDLLVDALPGVLHHELDAAVPRPEREHQSSAARHGVERIAHEVPHGVPQRRPVAAHGETASRSAAISIGRCPPPSSFQRVCADATASWTRAFMSVASPAASTAGTASEPTRCTTSAPARPRPRSRRAPRGATHRWRGRAGAGSCPGSPRGSG